MKEFFVYVLLDPRKEVNCNYNINDCDFNFQYKPFYVGKGKGIRIQQHYMKCNLKKNTHKNKIILKILNNGFQAIQIKLFENLDEEDAYRIEKDVITIIGLGNLTNKTDGGIGQCSSSMIGRANPMFGKHPIPWNKGLKGVVKSKYKGKKLEEIVGEGKAKEIKRKQSEKRIGKSWEEYFGEEAGKRIRAERSKERTGYKHSEETITKMKNSSTPEVKLIRRNNSIKKKQKTFDSDMEKYENQIQNYMLYEYTNNEIMKRINGISKYRLKKMIFLLRNNLTSDYFFIIKT